MVAVMKPMVMLIVIKMIMCAILGSIDLLRHTITAAAQITSTANIIFYK